MNKRYFGLQNNKRDECTRSASLNVVRNRLVIELDLMETRYVLFVGFTNKKTFSSISTSILSFIHSKIQAVPHFCCNYLNINVILHCMFWYIILNPVLFEHLFISTNSLLGNFESMHCSKTSFDTPKRLYKHTFVWFWLKCIKEYLANCKDSFYFSSIHLFIRNLLQGTKFVSILLCIIFIQTKLFKLCFIW